MKKKNTILGDLTPNPHNPRIVTDEALDQLRKSIAEFGDISGFVFNIRTKRLVGGHQRQKVLPASAQVEIVRKLDKADKQGTVATGFVIADGSRYAYREVDWPIEKEIAANMRANNNAGMFDNNAVVQLLQQLDGKMDLNLSGFHGEELASLVEQFSNLPPPTTPFSEFNDVNADGSVNFSFGSFKTKVRKDVYDKFAQHVMKKQGRDGGVLLDDIIAALI